ncbi:MAG: hypothetical protein DRN24_05805 [Thermoplasmata archaeon]|nr:MAG: hypothetical protein DRN24_05805 [Thermoplasmata archaeon]
MKKIALSLVIIVFLSIFAGCLEIDNNGSNTLKPKLLDSDKDGVSDIDDAFPYDPAASKDTDGDGYPDCWNENKDQSDSTTIPPLELDEFPSDPKAHKDTDHDGVADYYDINDFVNLSIDITIEKFKVTGWVDLLWRAQVYFIITINGEEVKKFNNNGRHWKTWVNVEQKVDATFHYDIPDNTTKKKTIIQIAMYDYDLLGKDDLIDITPERGGKVISLSFDNIKDTVSYNPVSKGKQGVLWYNISYPEEQKPQQDYTRVYHWIFHNKNWSFSIDIPTRIYDTYKNKKDYSYKGNRMPQKYGTKAMASFVTPDDGIVKTVADKLESMAKNNGFDTVTTINFILRFVQWNVHYADDDKTEGCIEYWRYPVETLVDKQGDCEDSAVLFASIIKTLGFDTTLFLYTLDEGEDKPVGHLAVGIHLQGNYGGYVEDKNGKKYFYCETAIDPPDVLNLGAIPQEFKGEEPAEIIPV